MILLYTKKDFNSILCDHKNKYFSIGYTSYTINKIMFLLLQITKKPLFKKHFSNLNTNVGIASAITSKDNIKLYSVGYFY